MTSRTSSSSESSSSSWSVIKSSARAYSETTSLFKPVKLNRSRMYSSSISTKYSLPLVDKNQVIQLLAERQRLMTFGCYRKAMRQVSYLFA